jgi:coenzyme F420-0:L-glutamate ligase/coenzyme F420-1:gamma-L-glutamate ligase
MEVIGIHTPLIRPGDDIVQILYSSLVKEKIRIEPHDILVLTEKVVATAQGRVRELKSVRVSPEARTLAGRYEVEADLAQLVLEESEEILGGIPHVLLTITHNTLMANAGIDRSNAPLGCAVLLPADPTREAWQLKQRFERLARCEIGIIISDSRTQPLRLGSVGLAVAVAGIEPVKDLRGLTDLYGRKLRIKRAAMADNLASAAELVIGETDERTPAALIRGAPVVFTKEHIGPEALTISRHECLYFAIFEEWHRRAESSRQG